MLWPENPKTTKENFKQKQKISTTQNDSFKEESDRYKTWKTLYKNFKKKLHLNNNNSRKKSSNMKDLSKNQII